MIPTSPTRRPVLQTMAALFLLVGAGQLISIGSGFAEYRSGRPGAATAADAAETSDAMTASAQNLREERIEMRRQTQALEAERRAIEAARLTATHATSTERSRLAGIYAQMPSGKAAAILAALTPAEAAAFVRAMPGESGAAILSEMGAPEAIAITRELITGQQSASR